jgi:hypothetical protein
MGCPGWGGCHGGDAQGSVINGHFGIPRRSRSGLLGRYPGVTPFWSNPCVNSRGVGRWRVVATVGVVTALVAACGGHNTAAQPASGTTSTVASSPSLSPADSSAPASGGSPQAQDAAFDTYGYGAKPSGVDYQPDVVVVGGGASMIRSASANGLVWTIAKAAPGASKLKVGSVMLMTSVAAGRVVEMHAEGDSIVVTLAPIDVTDVLRNGSIDVDQPLDASEVNYQSIPDLPWDASDPDTGDLPSTQITPTSFGGHGTFVAEPAVAELPAVAQPAAAPPAPGSMPYATKSGGDVTISDWKISPISSATKLGLAIERQGTLKVGISFAFSTDNLRIHGIDTVSNGQTTRSGFQVTGITGLTVSLDAGAAGGSSDNKKIKIELPIELNIPIPPSPATGGLPMNIKVKYKFIVETAITGNNSTMVAAGKWGLAGPIGFDGTKLLAPTFTVQQSIIDSLSGITLGPSGIVLAIDMKFQVGIGTAALSAGPFATITVALGLTNGSSLGAPLARCRGASLDMKGGAGVGLELSEAAIPILKALLPKGTKFKYSIETSTTLLHRAQVVPDVPLCTAGS